MNKNVFLLALVIWAASITANAQVLNKNTTFKIGGLGRSILTNDKMTGDLVDGDTLSPTKGVGGYTLFDLNMDLTVNKIFNANTILRMKNPYGSFYGQDIKFEFRQLQFNGWIGRSLRYEVGDIYIGMTPFTVFNANEPLDNKYESDVFRARRDILNYENFYVGNKWRLQGVQLFYNKDSVLAMKNIGLNVFGVRTNTTNDANIADRILFGGRLNVTQSDAFRVGLNAVTYSDLAVSQTAIAISNQVYSVDAAFTLKNETMLFSIGGEGGLNNFNYKNKSGDTSNASNDFFYQPEVKVGFKPVVLTASYRNVGPQFNSPTAQTQRVNMLYNPSIFPMVNQNTTMRGQALYDRTTDEGIYNRNISATLGVYLPQYGNITPYGSATPNRTGLSVGLATDTSLKNITAEVNVDLLSEINGVGTSELRKFTGIRGGVLFNIGGLAKLNRLIDVSFGYKSETTKRDGPASVDFKSSIIDAGLSVETLRKVDLVAGIKLLTASGNEYLPLRNNYNQVVNANGIDNSGGNGYRYDGSENIYSGGIRFRFAEYASASLIYNTSQVVRNNTSNQNYKFEQLFMSFILKF